MQNGETNHHHMRAGGRGRSDKMSSLGPGGTKQLHHRQGFFSIHPGRDVHYSTHSEWATYLVLCTQRGAVLLQPVLSLGQPSSSADLIEGEGHMKRETRTQPLGRNARNACVFVCCVGRQQQATTEFT